MTESPYHVPVLLQETLALLDPQPGQVFVDATLGGGGHAAAIAGRLRPGGQLIGIDQDEEALTEAGQRLASLADVVTLVQARFDTLADVLAQLDHRQIQGILFDLGVSSHQLDTPARGFSFKDPDALLDMRMNPTGGAPSAADLLNTLPERDLTRLLRDYADEKWAARIAQFVGERRRDELYRTVGQVVETVHAAIPVRARPAGLHAATRTFQALRIAVNEELTVLETALQNAVPCLASGGVIVVLSYHSGEDRIVKQFFAAQSGRGGGENLYILPPPATLTTLTKKPIVAAADEVAANPRARSAKLRAARKR